MSVLVSVATGTPRLGAIYASVSYSANRGLNRAFRDDRHHPRPFALMLPGATGRNRIGMHSVAARHLGEPGIW